MDFITHFWKLLSLCGVEVLVTIQSKVECFRYPDNSLGRKNWPRTVTIESSAG
jgi:hypothetical protein